MHTFNFARPAAALAALAFLAAQPAVAFATTSDDVATRAAWWIAAQFTDEGSVVGRTGVPDVPNTIAATLAMGATGHRHDNLDQTIAYVEAGVDDYVAGAFVDDYGPAGSGDRPGALANLLLFVDEVGADAHAFGGSDLVARLAATEQTVGPDPGSFGAQLDVFGHGYAHATIMFALATLTATQPSSASLGHLLDLQCATGGFPSGYRTAAQRVLDDCTGDSNATGLALAALAKVGGQDDAVQRAIAFLEEVRNDDDGWGYTPGAETDGNSTGLAALGLRLARVDVSSALAAIASLQFDCTAQAGQVGGVRFVASDLGPNTFATYQAMLALDRPGAADPVEPCRPAAALAQAEPAQPVLPVTGGGSMLGLVALLALTVARRS
jgi:hypothetical protein